MLVAITLAPLPLAGSVWIAAAILLAAGAAFAAVNVAVYALLDEVAPPGSGTEAFTWLTTAGAIGMAAGAALAGQLAGDLPAALAIPAAGAALALAVALAGPLGTRR